MTTNQISRSGNGFTLIELLLVITIVSLLMAILLPVLKHARENARRVICASNQRQILIATTVYGQDHHDLIPASVVNAAGARNWPHHAYLVQYPASSGTPDMQSCGLLYRLGYFPQPQGFYCPSHTSSSLAYGMYSQPWGADPSQTIRISYYYNVQTIEGGDDDRKPVYKRLIDHPRDAIFMMDAFSWNPPGSSHGSGNTRVWNVTYADGSVLSHKSASVSNMVFTADPTIGNNWTLFRQAVATLEASE